MIPVYVDQRVHETISIIEDFHFAFEIYRTEYNEPAVYVHDACHSLLYRE
jgi:hypothetical protein